jgi:TetR/AcrR family transcriptional regulator
MIGDQVKEPMDSEKVKTDAESGARERLLTAALNLFNEKGYSATSVREIVEAAGVTKPVLYYYFGNKEGIYVELMDSSYSTFESLVAGVEAVDGSAEEKIIAFCSNLFEASKQRLPLVRLIYSMYYGPPQGAPHFDFERYSMQMLEVIQQMVGGGVANGELTENNVADVSRAIMAIVTSAVNEQLTRLEYKLDRDGMVRTLRLLMSGIARR